MLIGQYIGKIGAKGRVAFPKKFRKVLGDLLIVTLGYENSLIIVSLEGWRSLLEGTEGKPFTHQAARETQRFLLGGATEVGLDNKGRFIIPTYLRDYAKITNEVVFVGLSRYVEVWDKARWDEYQKNLEKKVDILARELSEEKKV